MAIFESRKVGDTGLAWVDGSLRNLLLGIALGIGAAALAILPAVALGLAHYQYSPTADVSWRGAFFTPLLLFCGALGEEIAFRGFTLQYLIRGYGRWAAILGIAALFGVLHAGNPGATTMSTINTAGFGVVFGMAVLRSRDLWLPAGIHFAWNTAAAVPPESACRRHYNKGDRIRADMEGRGFMEWRTLRAGSERDHLRGDRGAFLCSPEGARGQRHRIYGAGIRAGGCIGIALLLASGLAQAGVIGPTDKLTDDEKIDLLRGLMSEYATMKVPLARSKKPLEFFVDGTFNRQYWENTAKQMGPAGRLGEIIQLHEGHISGRPVVVRYQRRPDQRTALVRQHFGRHGWNGRPSRRSGGPKSDRSECSGRSGASGCSTPQRSQRHSDLWHVSPGDLPSSANRWRTSHPRR